MAMGRPREFDLDKAVANALRVFLAKGYEGASTAELAAAMRIGSPSLYAAFGSKEGLFRKAMERHAVFLEPILQHALGQDTAFAVAERFMRGNADALTDPAKPPGCLFVQGALRCSDAGLPVRDELATQRVAGEPLLRDRFARAAQDGDLPARVDPATLARYVVTVMNGLAVRAAGGASRAELYEVVDMVLALWPSGSRDAADSLRV